MKTTAGTVVNGLASTLVNGAAPAFELRFDGEAAQPGVYAYAAASTWPSDWNGGVAPEGMQAKFDTWRVDYSVTTFDETAKAAFLLNIDPQYYTAALDLTAIELKDGKVKLTSNYNLENANGVVYLRYGTEVDSLLVNTALVDLDATLSGSAVVNIDGDEDAEFFQLCIDFTVPSPTVGP